MAKNTIFLWVLVGMGAFLLLSAGLGTSNARIESTSTIFHTEAEDDSLSLRNGQELYTTRCFNCHTTYISHAYSESTWSLILEAMSIKAGIDSSGRVDLSNYVFDQLRQTDTSYVQRTIGMMQQW